MGGTVPKRNPESPWNPANPAEISPEEYEKRVVDWLREAAGTLDKFEVKPLRHLSGPGGDYEFDAVAQLTILNGAQIVILVECKRYSRPVEREKLLSLWAKMQDVKAHKAMIFATCGFQSGALEYAKVYGIATVAFVQGEFLYETRGARTPGQSPPWAGLPDYAGIFMSKEDDRVSCSTIKLTNTDVLRKWLQSL
jgi:restriction system protein